LDLTHVGELSERILDRVSEAIVGKRGMLELVLTSILARGHVLFEDVPGLAKTLTASSFAQVLGMEFRRIQFTPDLLPSDITGSHIYDRNRSEFVLAPGPIVANVILADEINRATPKTQSALLEAMQEGQVSIAGETRPLPQPFLVIATQNPIEYEGTFPLPEAQLDRFLVRLNIGYPGQKEEIEVLQRRLDRKRDEVTLEPVCDTATLLDMQSSIEEVRVSEDVERYVVDIVRRTREHTSLYIGASPRGSLALVKLARARAAIDSRDFVLPDDVKQLAIPALAHRLILNPDLWARRTSTSDVLEGILQTTPVPKAA
jgi:MoxR-like ATPase